MTERGREIEREKEIKTGKERDRQIQTYRQRDRESER